LKPHWRRSKRCGMKLEKSWQRRRWKDRNAVFFISIKWDEGHIKYIERHKIEKIHEGRHIHNEKGYKNIWFVTKEGIIQGFFWVCVSVYVHILKNQLVHGNGPFSCKFRFGCLKYILVCG
jgi:hypothetical protein